MLCCAFAFVVKSNLFIISWKYQDSWVLGGFPAWILKRLFHAEFLFANNPIDVRIWGERSRVNENRANFTIRRISCTHAHNPTIQITSAIWSCNPRFHRIFTEETNKQTILSLITFTLCKQEAPSHSIRASLWMYYQNLLTNECVSNTIFGGSDSRLGGQTEQKTNLFPFM